MIVRRRAGALVLALLAAFTGATATTTATTATAAGAAATAPGTVCVDLFGPAEAAALNGFYARAGLGSTYTATGMWGLTTTSAADQVELVRLLVGDRAGLFSEDSRTVARHYLESVVPSQRWGVPAGLPAGWGAALKNGFFDSTCCRWRINTTGRVASPHGGGYDITILTDGWASYAEGVAAVNVLAARVNELLAVADPTRLRPFGVLDEARAGPGQVALRGWATLPPDQPSVEAPLVVHVWFTGPQLAAPAVVAVMADARRPDVGLAHPGTGDAHGFAAVVPSPGPGPVRACAYAIDPAGERNPLLGCSDVAPSAGSSFGLFGVETDAGPGAVRVHGWAIDPDVAASPVVDVVAVRPGTLVVSASVRVVADGSRPDVGAAFPGYGDAHGFGGVLAGLGGGEWAICVIGREAGGLGGDAVLGCRRATVSSGSPFGRPDAVAAVGSGAGGPVVRVTGWAIDPDTSAPVAVTVVALRPGTWTIPASVVGVAARARPDVAGAYPGYGEGHGYDIALALPESGTWVVCAIAWDAAGGHPGTVLGCTITTLA